MNILESHEVGESSVNINLFDEEDQFRPSITKSKSESYQNDVLIESGIDDLTIKNGFHVDHKSRQNESFANLKSEKTVQAQIVGNLKQE